MLRRTTKQLWQLPVVKVGEMLCCHYVEAHRELRCFLTGFWEVLQAGFIKSSCSFMKCRCWCLEHLSPPVTDTQVPYILNQTTALKQAEVEVGLAGHVLPDRSQKTIGGSPYFLSSHTCDEMQKYVWNFFLSQASVFSSFVLLMGQNMEWNILKISNWARGIEHDAAS